MLERCAIAIVELGVGLAYSLVVFQLLSLYQSI